jgi:hypothetical protein
MIIFKNNQLFMFFYCNQQNRNEFHYKVDLSFYLISLFYLYIFLYIIHLRYRLVDRLLYYNLILLEIIMDVISYD